MPLKQPLPGATVARAIPFSFTVTKSFDSVAALRNLDQKLARLVQLAARDSAGRFSLTQAIKPRDARAAYNPAREQLKRSLIAAIRKGTR